MQQLALWAAQGIDAEFWAFHRHHPDVYRQLRDLCRRWGEVRRDSRWSINGAFEVLRWERHIAGLPDPIEDFKLNNNYRSRYARLLMDNEPDLATIFELRALKTPSVLA